MTTLYKLTDEDGYTRMGESNETKWGENVTHEAKGNGGLCTDSVIHAYEHPLIAVFMNPIHAALQNPLLWKAEGEIHEREGQLKCGCKKLTTIKQIPLPEITIEQRVRIAIYCALSQYSNPSFVKWANDWLSGKDRSARAARAAARSSWAVARAVAEAEAARAAETEAAWAARAVARAVAADFDLLAIIKSVVGEGK